MATPQAFPFPAPALFQQRRVDVLLSLQRAAQQITSILELDELLDTIVHRIAVDFGCIESYVVLVDGEEFELAAIHGCTHSKKGERWPVTQGLTGHVVATGSPYYAPDVTQELMWKACEHETRSEVVFPLQAGNRIIGVFGAAHHDVDAFPKAQIELLKGLASHIAIAVDNAQCLQRERQRRQQLQAEQEEASKIQRSLLPRSLPAVPGFALEAECISAGAVGGDWYDFIPLSDGKWGVVLADVSGKGMAAALLMTQVRGMVRSLAPIAAGPGELLGRVNRTLLDDAQTGRYVTMIYGVLDPAKRKLTFASAGHPWPLLCHGADVRPLHTDAGMPLGLFPCDFTEHEVKFCHDFRLLFYTDGISEELNRDQQEFGPARLADFVANHDCSVNDLLQDIREFSGTTTLADDATVLLLRSAA